METKLTAHRPRRRQYSSQFKADILTQCREPNASIGGVALANGLHSNMVHRWLRESQVAERTNKAESSPLPSAFVALSMELPEQGVRRTDVQLNLQRADLRVTLTCPLEECAALLRELLR